MLLERISQLKQELNINDDEEEEEEIDGNGEEQ